MSARTPVVPADDQGIAHAARLLRDGGLVAIPTETVYGLAARADDSNAVSRIFAAKGRPAHNPLIVHVADFAQADDLVEWDATPSQVNRQLTGPGGTPYETRAFAQQVWPGPVTLVLPRRADAPLAAGISAGLATLAVRMPAHPIARALIAQTGALAAPSANRSGFVSPTSAAHVLATLDGRIDLILDAGPCEGGVESTILAPDGAGGWRVLRSGLAEGLASEGITADGNSVRQHGKVEAPGQFASHYSPAKPVRLEARSVHAGEFMIGFGAIAGDVTLSPSGNLEEAAQRLYACLHEAAAAPQMSVAVAPVPREGLGIAINDRLSRAAA